MQRSRWNRCWDVSGKDIVDQYELPALSIGQMVLIYARRWRQVTAWYHLNIRELMNYGSHKLIVIVRTQA
jgi:hypothetical protein